MVQKAKDLLEPPEAVRGSTTLDKEKFRKKLTVPCIDVNTKDIGRIIGLPLVLKSRLTGLVGIKPVSNGPADSVKKVLFDPAIVGEEEKPKIVESIGKVLGIYPKFETLDVDLSYDNWNIKQCIKAVLPTELEFSGYSQVGHIAHLNLREELAPFKAIIGQLLLDKVPWVKTVVNKTDSIATEFRNFDMELLAGEENFLAEMKEKGLMYKFDFRKVFWNSRLSTEHGRIVDHLTKNTVVFDIFAGVGPFALPAAKKGVLQVFANDKNPNSTFYMAENVKLNKIPEKAIEIHTLDAVDFMNDVVAKNVVKLVNDSATPVLFQSIMNLPAIAIEFLPNFRGLLRNQMDVPVLDELRKHKFVVHCHMFVKASEDVALPWYFEEAQKLVRQKLKLFHLNFDEVQNVRKVAGRKEMFCCSFTLPWEYLLENPPS